MGDNIRSLSTVRNAKTNAMLAKDYVDKFRNSPEEEVQSIAPLIDAFYDFLIHKDPEGPMCLNILPHAVLADDYLELVFFDISALATLRKMNPDSDAKIYELLTSPTEIPPDPKSNQIFSMRLQELETKYISAPSDWKQLVFNAVDEWMLRRNTRETNPVIFAALGLCHLIQEHDFKCVIDGITFDETDTCFTWSVTNGDKHITLTFNVDRIYKAVERLGKLYDVFNSAVVETADHV